ncbi:MAG: PqqD family protein [Candidatus Omnitrophica bacterium]|nr:PqqD family protein [Candidatus Omnitrophota bacterium]
MLETSYEKSPNIVSRKIAEETVLVPIRQTLGEEPAIFTLNEVGARIWELIDGKKSVREVCETVISEFEIDPHVAEKDLLGLLAQFKETGIIREK